MVAAVMGQRQLALELRYRIDIAQRTHTEDARSRVRELVALYPHGVRSSHVRHNLGAGRRKWLEEHL